MLDPITLALILAGSVIVVGFLSDRLFERTAVPDMMLLIALGVVLGPLSGLVRASSIMGLAPYLTALALVFILFDGGMSMDLYRAFAESPRAAVLAVLGFAASAVATTLFMALALPEVPTAYSVLFGTILGGSSSVVVISIASKIGVSKKCLTILSLESVMTDILCVVFSLAVIEIILKGTADVVTIGRLIASRFSTGIVLGLILGLVWLNVLKRIAKAPHAYMLTLAVVLLAYALSEALGGSGALCSLLFGLVLGNEKEVYRVLRVERQPVVDAGLRRFGSEIAFLLRTFFFVYVGLIFEVRGVWMTVMGLLLSLILLLVRFGAVRVATVRSSELVAERPIMSVLLTRGLAAAVLATLPLQHANENPIFRELAPVYVNVAVLVILTTAIIATVGIPLLKRKSNQGSPAPGGA